MERVGRIRSDVTPARIIVGSFVHRIDLANLVLLLVQTFAVIVTLYFGWKTVVEAREAEAERRADRIGERLMRIVDETLNIQLASRGSNQVLSTLHQDRLRALLVGFPVDLPETEELTARTFTHAGYPEDERMASAALDEQRKVAASETASPMRRPKRLTPTRLILGSLVIALALGAAVWLHAPETRLGSHTECAATTNKTRRAVSLGRGCPPGQPGSLFRSTVVTVSSKAHWQDPLAIFVAIAGLGLGGAIIVSRPRRAA